MTRLGIKSKSSVLMASTLPLSYQSVNFIFGLHLLHLREFYSMTTTI